MIGLLVDRVIKLKHALVDPVAFKALMRFFYTDRLELRNEYVAACVRLCKQCRLSELSIAVQHHLFMAEARNRNWIDIDVAESRVAPVRLRTLKDDLNRFVRSCVLPSNILLRSGSDNDNDGDDDDDDGSNSVGESSSSRGHDDEVEADEWQAESIEHRDARIEAAFADMTIQAIDTNTNTDTDTNMSASASSSPRVASIFCHQMIVSKQSEYLSALLHFQDTLRDSEGFVGSDMSSLDASGSSSSSSSWSWPSAAPGTRVVQLSDMSLRVVALTIEYLYSSYISNIDKVPIETVLEVLHVANRLLCSELAAYAQNQLVTRIEVDNVLELYEVAEFFALRRLEEACIEVMAMNLEQLIVQPHFEALVVASANAIKNRQATDSIIMVDEIETALANVYWFDQAQLKLMQQLLVDFLDRLHLQRAPSAMLERLSKNHHHQQQQQQLESNDDDGGDNDDW